jgi:hypothetical protein
MIFILEALFYYAVPDLGSKVTWSCTMLLYESQQEEER